MKAHVGCAVLGLLLFVGPGCVSLSSFNTPETTEKDAVQLGAGIGGMRVGQSTTGPLPLFYGRVGLGERVDLGGKFYFPLGGISADIKYQLVDMRVKLAADLGGSIFFTGPNAVHPALIVGTEHVYGGPRLMIFPGKVPSGEKEYGVAETDFSRTMPGAVIGGAVGNEEFRVMPEVSVYISRSLEKPIFVPALGLRFRVGSK